MHMGSGHTLGEVGGEQNHTLLVAEMPTHSHTLNGTTIGADVPIASANLLASAAGLYAGASNTTTMNPASLGMTGGSQAHLNMQPYLTLSFCIALQGIFPSQN
jgi:microcystin-dependent protein